MDPGVLIIGAGGLGCPAALALGAGGVRRLGIVDDDRVDATNLHRQVLFADADADRGELKAVAAARALARRFPALDVVPHAVRFDVTTAAELVAAYDVVIDGSDNFATKFLANDAAVLARRPLVHGAAVGTGGQLLTVPAGVGPSCAEAGVLGPVPGVIGALAGVEAALLLRGQAPAFVGRLLQYDSARMTLRTAPFNPNTRCAVCAAGARIHALTAGDYPAADCAVL